MFVKLAVDRRIVSRDRDNFGAFKLVVEGQRGDIGACAGRSSGTPTPDADAPGSRKRRCGPAGVAAGRRLAAILRRHDREGAAARLDRRRPEGNQGPCGVGGVSAERKRADFRRPPACRSLSPTVRSRNAAAAETR